MKEVLTIARPDARAGQRERGQGVVHQHGRGRPADEVDPRQQRGRLSCTAGTSSTNQLTQRIQLTSGIGESYTPTAIGADGAVYAVNNAVLFSIRVACQRAAADCASEGSQYPSGASPEALAEPHP